MNEKGPILGAAAPIDKGRPRMYAPRKYAAWMIGVLAVFAVCSVFFVVSLGWSGAWVMVVTGLIFATLFAAWRRSRAYGGVHWCIYIFLVMALIAMIFPVFHNFREAAWWVSCMGNLSRLGLGLQNYENARKKFPPAFIADKEGKPAYSWRAMIFPYIESGGVYRRFNFDKPWDSPEQKKNLGKLAYACSFQCPSCPRRPDRPDWRADYVAVLGEDTFWRSDGKPREAKEITKDLGDTPVLIEIDDSDILWYEPRDVTLDDFLSGKLSWSESAVHEYRRFLEVPVKGRNVLFADGSVRFIEADLTPDQLRRFFLITEPFDLEKELPRAASHQPVFRYVVFYIWLATLFVQFVYIFFPARIKLKLGAEE